MLFLEHLIFSLIKTHIEDRTRDFIYQYQMKIYFYSKKGFSCPICNDVSLWYHSSFILWLHLWCLPYCWLICNYIVFALISILQSWDVGIPYQLKTEKQHSGKQKRIQRSYTLCCLKLVSAHPLGCCEFSTQWPAVVTHGLYLTLDRLCSTESEGNVNLKLDQTSLKFVFRNTACLGNIWNSSGLQCICERD